MLRREGLEAPVPSTVTQTLQRGGVALDRDGGGAQPFMRFEYPHPNDLRQMDFKSHVALGSGQLHPLRVLDDHSAVV